MSVKLPAELVDQALDLVRDYDLEIRPYVNYSGRGMFGDTCFGVVGSTAALQLFVAMMLQVLNDRGEDVLVDDFIAAIARGEQDSMGLDRIAYWRAIELDGELAETEDA